MRARIVVLAALAILGQRASAQGYAARVAFPEEGKAVRAATNYTVVSGIVRRRSRDSLWLTTPDLTVQALGRAEIFKISTYGKQHARGAKRGAVVGALIGVVAVGASVWVDTRGTGDCICIPLTYVVAPAALTLPVIGAGIGAIGAPMGWGNPVYY